MFRKILFWSHLACGVAAGLVILMMSITGVLLAYERQITAWVEQGDYVPDPAQGDRLSLEQLHFIARTQHGEFTPTAIVVKNDPGAPVAFSAGRRGGIDLNPYTGETMEVGSPGLERFFSTVTGIHRWFNLTGENRNAARAVTGASNLMFLFLILSGLYLWLPPLWQWGMFKVRLLFRHSGGNGKARDFNWHHVFGVWCAIPLAFIVASASVFYYPWANNLVYRVYGEEPPSRGPAPPRGNASADTGAGSLPAVESRFLSLDDLFTAAAGYMESAHGGWRQISLNIPRENAATVSFSIDQGNGGQPHLRHNLSLNRETGTVESWEPFSSQSPGRQTRSFIRFLHTGEVFGLVGQTIAGLVSLAGVFMVWTGLALAYRRLLQPLFRKKSSA